MRAALLYLLVLVLVPATACRESTTRPVETPPVPTCGDGIIDPGEDCDGSNPGNSTCLTLGFDQGQLLCAADCTYSTRLCTKRCGNGNKDLGEACDGTLGVDACAAWGFNRCTDSCTLDTSHCVAQAFEAAPPLEVAKGGPAIITDLSPAGPGDLVMAVPSYNRVETFAWNLVTGFDATTSRKLSFQHTPVRAEACDANGDGNADVATLNQDGTVDQLLFTGSGFALSPVDGGCPNGAFLGSGPMGRAPMTKDLALACGASVLLVGNGTSRRLPTPDAGASALVDVTADGLVDVLWVDGASALHTLAAPGFIDDGGVALPTTVSALSAGDLDADGDADLAVIVGGEVRLLENTGVGYAPRNVFPAPSASMVRVVDLDLDGRPDVLFATTDDLVVRRNLGQWVLREERLNAGAGPRLSVAIGDVDGDGDPDVAATSSTSGDATRTVVIRNRVR